MNLRTIISHFVALAIGATAMWLWQRPEPAPREVDLRGLNAQLNSVAEKALPVPTLQTPSVQIKVPATELKERLLATMKLAETLGGVARQGLDRKLARVVLATMPADRVELFLSAAEEGWLERRPEKEASSELVDCEVVLLPE